MTALDFAVLALAAWRVAMLLVLEPGPFDLVNRFRQAVGAQEPLAGRYVQRAFFDKLFSCLWCMTFWTGLAIAGVWQLYEPAVQLIAIWGAATALAILLTRE